MRTDREPCQGSFTTWQFTPGDELERYADLHHDGMEKKKDRRQGHPDKPRTSELRSAHSGRISTNCRRLAKLFEKKVAAIMMVECSDLGREISEDLCDAMER